MRSRSIAANALLCASLAGILLWIPSQHVLAGPVKPEDVYLSNTGIACPTEAEFLQIVEHAQRGETTLAEQMMRGGGGNCVNFPGGVRIRVLHADSSIFASHNVIQFNPADHPGYPGAWGSDQLLGKKLK